MFMSLSYHGTKFQCRHAIAALIEFGKQLDKEGQDRRYNEDRRQNTIIRITNVVFSNEFFEHFLKINDAKSRSDHESRNMAKHFWTDCTDAYNDYEDEDENAAFQIVLDSDNPHFEKILDADLHDTETMTSDVMRKKVTELFKIRKMVQKNMTLSGTHDSDPYNFMEVATNKCNVSGYPHWLHFTFFHVVMTIQKLIV